MADRSTIVPGPAATRRRVPAGLIGAIAAGMLVEAAVAGHHLDLANSFEWDWATTALRASDEALDAEVLCFGDSQTKLAALPGVVERRAGRAAFNLAVFGGQPSTSYFLLRRVLREGHRPGAIVVDFFPEFLTKPPRAALPSMGHLADLRECLDLGIAAGDPELLGELLAGWALPSVRHRMGLRAVLAGRLRGRPPAMRAEKPGLARNRRLNRGAQVMPVAGALDYDPVAWKAIAYPDRRPHPVALAYLDRFLRLAEGHAIPVFWVVMPEAAALRAECARGGYDDRYERFLRAALDRYPGVILLDARRGGFADELFYDPHHLGREGALAFSVALAEALDREASRAVPGDRWVALEAPASPAPADLLPEDIEQSAVAARGAPGGTRRR